MGGLINNLGTEVVVKIQNRILWYLPAVLLRPLGGSLDRTKESAGANENAEFYEGTAEHTVLA